jgi:acyl carrier protein
MEQNDITIKGKIKVFIIQESFADHSKIQDGTFLFKEGYFDSMGFVMLITFIEKEFGIKTNDTDLVEENFESINAITDFIIRKVNH